MKGKQLEIEGDQIYEGLIKDDGLDKLKNGSEYPEKYQRDVREAIDRLKHQLNKLEKEQVTEYNATFQARLGRYVKIKLIKYTLNKLTV